MATMNEGTITAAGVVVFHPEDDPANAERRFLAVHRPHREDWSLPKGKVDPGEITPCTAVRECDEETGYRVSLGARLPDARYLDHQKPKEVHYWIGTVRDDEGFAPDEEVDAITWVPVPEATEFLTYSNDAELVRLAAGAPETTPFIILRHAKAMKRGDFDGKNDAERPLSGRGRGEAKKLIDALDAYGISAVHSSPYKRCVSSVTRMAKAADVEVQTEPWASEGGHEEDPEVTAGRAVELFHQVEPTVLCTHRPVLPTILAAITKHLGLPPNAVQDDPNWDARLPPGGMIVVHREWTESGPRAFAVEQHHLPR